MEKFLKSGVNGSLCPASRSLKRGAQRKLKDCKKVVTLEPGTTRVVFGLDTVLQAKEVLECADSAPEKVLEKLRFLSCLQIDEATLRNSGVGFSVRKQKKSANADVAALAARIISKWQGIVLDEQQVRKGRRRLAMQPG